MSLAFPGLVSKSRALYKCRTMVTSISVSRALHQSPSQVQMRHSQLRTHESASRHTITRTSLSFLSACPLALSYRKAALHNKHLLTLTVTSISLLTCSTTRACSRESPTRTLNSSRRKSLDLPLIFSLHSSKCSLLRLFRWRTKGISQSRIKAHSQDNPPHQRPPAFSSNPNSFANSCKPTIRPASLNSSHQLWSLGPLHCSLRASTTIWTSGRTSRSWNRCGSRT